MNNRDIAKLFENIADMLSIRGDNFRRVLAYRKGAEAVRDAELPMSVLVEQGTLTKLPGIGKTLAEKITEMVETGQLEFYTRLSEDVPPSLLELMRVEGLGPKRIKQVYEQLNVLTLSDLQVVAESGKLAELPRLGVKSAEKILKNIQALQKYGDDRTQIGSAYPIAHAILAELTALEGVVKSAVGGSLRRMQETIGDIDLLIGVADGTDPAPIMQHFVNLPAVESISGHGATKSSVQLVSGLKVDLRVLPVQNWGTLLSYFTGSQAHNVRLRERAQKQGLSLNEYSFTPEDGSAEIICPTEEAVYAALNLPYIAPTLRQGRGEIEAASAGRLPTLIQQHEIISDLHMHSTWSDGKHSILEMAQAAQARGLRYIVITDHSRSLGVANGLSIERLYAQADEIAAANAIMGADFRVLHGTEMEIKADGTLDYPDDVLADLDFVIASLHVSLRQPRAQIMERVQGALQNPHVDMIAHPTGRSIGKREGADMDMEALFAEAASTGTILEINANPRRLDLRDQHARRAAALGCTLAINCDAHHIDQLDLLRYGVATAQRGWISAENVVNTWSLDRFLTYIASEKN